MQTDEPAPRPPHVWLFFAPIWWLATRGRAGLAYSAILLAHLVLLGGGYLAVLRFAEWRAVSVCDPTSALDLWVPPVPWTIVVYSSLYLYWPLTVLLAPKGLRGVQTLLVQLQAQVWIACVSFAFFLFLPTKILIRADMEAVLESSGEFVRGAFAELYAVDAPWNSWPSLHVSLSLLMVLCWNHFTQVADQRHRWWKPGRADAWVLRLGLPCWLALCASIMTTKQHFALDIWTGALLGWLGWRFYLRARLESCAPRRSAADSPQNA